MTAMITRISQVTTTTDYPGICVFVKISGDEGDGFFASPSRRDAGELCQRINGYNKVVAERDEMRKQLAKTADALKKLRRKVARAKKTGGVKCA